MANIFFNFEIFFIIYKIQTTLLPCKNILTWNTQSKIQRFMKSKTKSYDFIKVIGSSLFCGSTASNKKYFKFSPRWILLNTLHHSFTTKKQTWSTNFNVMHMIWRKGRSKEAYVFKDYLQLMILQQNLMQFY